MIFVILIFNCGEIINDYSPPWGTQITFNNLENETQLILYDIQVRKDWCHFEKGKTICFYAHSVDRYLPVSTTQDGHYQIDYEIPLDYITSITGIVRITHQ